MLNSVAADEIGILTLTEVDRANDLGGLTWFADSFPEGLWLSVSGAIFHILGSEFKGNENFADDGWVGDETQVGVTGFSRREALMSGASRR